MRSQRKESVARCVPRSATGARGGLLPPSRHRKFLPLHHPCFERVLSLLLILLFLHDSRGVARNHGDGARSCFYYYSRRISSSPRRPSSWPNRPGPPKPQKRFHSHPPPLQGSVEEGENPWRSGCGPHPSVVSLRRLPRRTLRSGSALLVPARERVASRRFVLWPPPLS